jgi:hypothetical protein
MNCQTKNCWTSQRSTKIPFQLWIKIGKKLSWPTLCGQPELSLYEGFLEGSGSYKHKTEKWVVLNFVNVYQIKYQCYVLVNLTPSEVFFILNIE